LARVHGMRHYYGKGIEVYEKMIATEPQDPVVYNNLGVYYLKQGQGEDARRVFLTAYKEAPDNPVLILNLAITLDRYVPQPKESYGYYDCFLRLFPKEAEARKVPGRMNQLREQNDFAPQQGIHAIACPQMVEQSMLEQFIKEDWLVADVIPHTEILPSGDTQLEAPENLYFGGKYQQAAQMLIAKEQSGSLGSRGYFLMGMAYLKMNDPFRAIPRLQKAVEQEPQNSDYIYELGWAYEMANDSDEAVEIWKQGRQRFKNDPRFVEVLKGR